MNMNQWTSEVLWLLQFMFMSSSGFPRDCSWWKTQISYEFYWETFQQENKAYKVLPVARWGVVKGIIFSLHFEIKYKRALLQSFPQQILPYDHNSDSCASHVLLGARKY